MKQIILPFRTGIPQIIEVPQPKVQEGHVLIRSRVSVISSGTEQMLLNFGQASWLGKVRSQPDKLRQVLEKIKTDGLQATIRSVRNKLDQPITLGYAQAGIVEALGVGVHDLKVGDRVASNGPHAEWVCVPRKLVAPIPEGVSDEQAAFTVVAAIALQGIRLVQPTLGETVVVYGLGLIGQLTAQILLANGCRVLGIDLQEERVRLAESFGVIPIHADPESIVSSHTGGQGADAVIITASSQRDAIMEQAAVLCRKRGRIVLTGVVGLNLRRDLFFKKEISFQVSASYGPGRYDPSYEQHGQDYPLAYVRWTEARNFEAVLELMRRGSLNPSPLISQRYPLANLDQAYQDLNRNLASLFLYPQAPESLSEVSKQPRDIKPTGSDIALVGAGNFCSAVLLPGLKAAKANIHSIYSQSGWKAALLAKKFGIPIAGADTQELWEDASVKAVLIATQHNSHASLTVQALQAAKHVFVEKPLAITTDEFAAVREALQLASTSLTIGFNRRFAPLALKAKGLLTALSGPISIVMNINAGSLPDDHWTRDPKLGGGRILGEACHFLDLCAFFAGSEIEEVCATALPTEGGALPESCQVLLRFINGSTAVLNYLCNGSRKYDKERIEIFKSGTTIILANWRSLQTFGFKKEGTLRQKQDKGHFALLHQWNSYLEHGGTPPIPESAILNSTAASFAVLESIRTNTWVHIHSGGYLRAAKD
ncbi:MAG: bi-domain-containing oxidoreductase [Bacteroidetes bacterium]|nr:bi-domain-containing oxidoreductase [Bacteroidota bacterium]